MNYTELKIALLDKIESEILKIPIESTDLQPRTSLDFRRDVLKVLNNYKGENVDI